MNKYETIFLIEPTDKQEKVDEVIKKYKDLIGGFSDKEIKVDDLGTRKLAYTVRGFDKANYIVLYFHGKPENITELERQYRIDDDVIKFMTVKHEEQEFKEESEDEEEY